MSETFTKLSRALGLCGCSLDSGWICFMKTWIVGKVPWMWGKALTCWFAGLPSLETHHLIKDSTQDWTRCIVSLEVPDTPGKLHSRSSFSASSGKTYESTSVGFVVQQKDYQPKSSTERLPKVCPLIMASFICFIKGQWWWRLYTIYAFTLGLISCVGMNKAVLTVLLNSHENANASKQKTKHCVQNKQLGPLGRCLQEKHHEHGRPLSLYTMIL